MYNDEKELKGLIRARKRVYLTERSNRERFSRFAEKCEYRKLVIEEELYCENWHSCTNNKHVFRGGFAVQCSFSLCPLLRICEKG